MYTAAVGVDVGAHVGPADGLLMRDGVELVHVGRVVAEALDGGLGRGVGAAIHRDGICWG